MIKVLVVEDDKLARKGLVHAMPWARFDMEVVGEAGSGRQALDFLEAHSVDLMLTDLAMPGMSGIELMRATSSRFPELLCVVLTFHQELEFAQEAIRLGVIDYIAKVQLEKERFDEVLCRIRDRFLRERGRIASAPAADRSPEWLTADSGYALLSLEPDAECGWIRTQAEGADPPPLEIGEGAWLWLPADGPSADAVLPRIRKTVAEGDGWALITMSGLTGERGSRVQAVLRRYRQAGFFYDFDGHAPLLAMSLAELDAAGQKTVESVPEGLRQQWLAFDWLCGDAPFRSLLGELEAARPADTALFRLLVELESEWNRIYMPVMSDRVEAPAAIRSWKEVERWLTAVRESALLCARKLTHAPEVAGCILRAVRIVDAEMAEPLFAVDIARRVGLSRSYFCQCFKDITGRSFNHYLRFMRVEKAKLMLTHTEAQICQIAGQVGYTDEKYFSRAFREQTGVLPSEFRRAGRHPS
jgi:two-component system response regulator YesN